MIVYQNFISFDILGTQVNLISDDDSQIQNTVAEIDNQYHYLGDVFPNLATATFIWEKLNSRELTSEEKFDIFRLNPIP